VQWIVGLDESFVVRTRLWPAFRAVADHVTPWPGFWPYDVSVNVIRAWDHTLVHTDCSAEELEYTLLLYLNDDLGIDDGGETLFFDDGAPPAGKGPRLLHRAGGGGEEGARQEWAGKGEDRAEDEEEDEEDEEDEEWSRADEEDEAAGRGAEDEDEDGEGGQGGGGYGASPKHTDVIASVRPVFGRVAIFNGNVPHSARPPYGTYPGIRYTLAVKMTSSRVSAVAKNLASMVHGSVDELQTKVEGGDDGEAGSATAVAGRRRRWKSMLQQAEGMYGEVQRLQKAATASDRVRWSGRKPEPGRPWSTTCQSRGPPAMTRDASHLERLRAIAAQNHAFGEQAERQGWLELAERLGIEEVAEDDADDL